MFAQTKYHEKCVSSFGIDDATARELREAVKQRDEVGRTAHREALFTVHRLEVEKRDLGHDVRMQETHEVALLGKHRALESPSRCRRLKKQRLCICPQARASDSCPHLRPSG